MPRLLSRPITDVGHLGQFEASIVRYPLTPPKTPIKLSLPAFPLRIFHVFCDGLLRLLGWFLHLNLFHLAKELQLQLVNDEDLNLIGYFRGDILLDFQEGAAVASASHFSYRALSGPQHQSAISM